MKETSVFTVAADAGGVMALPTGSADTTLARRFAWVSASTGVSAHAQVSLGEEFVAFADEFREWAELEIAAGLEGWPDDAWPGLACRRD